MPRQVRIVAFIPAALTIFACGETPFRFFDTPPPVTVPTGGQPGSGGEPCGDSCGSGAVTPAPSGGMGGEGSGSGAVGSGDGGAPTEPMEQCIIPGTDTKVERLQVIDNGLCVSRGTYQTLLGEPSYTISLTECSSTPRQLWILTELSEGVVEVRNYSVDLNLDVQYAAVVPWTPIDLYDPHRFQNQLFVVTDNPDGSFKLSPQNAPTQCLSAWDGSLVLRNCDPNYLGQSFRRLECEE